MELVRHRLMSYSQESTRYCNYSKDKFSNELTFILPLWVNQDPKDIDNNTYADIVFRESLHTIEKKYLTLLREGWTPQQARAVLPNALKTEIMVTGFVSDWKHIFRLRTFKALTGKPHPDMETLMDSLLDKFVSKGIIAYEEL